MAANLKLPMGFEDFEEVRTMGFIMLIKQDLSELFWKIRAR